MTASRRFPKAIRRVNHHLDELERLLAPVDVSGRLGHVMLTFIDADPELTRVTRRGPNDTIHDVEVGYDFEHNYPEEDDVLVIQLIEEKLKTVFADEGFGDRREQLLQVVTDWTTRAIGA